MDFMSWNFIDNEAYVCINVVDYTPTPIEKIETIIERIRTQATDLYLKFDLSGKGVVSIDEFKSISKLIQDVIEYTKNDNILRRISIVGAGFFFKLLYKPVSLAIPKEIRDMIVFL